VRPTARFWSKNGAIPRRPGLERVIEIVPRRFLRHSFLLLCPQRLELPALRSLLVCGSATSRSFAKSPRIRIMESKGSYRRSGDRRYRFPPRVINAGYAVAREEACVSVAAEASLAKSGLSGIKTSKTVPIVAGVLPFPCEAARLRTRTNP